MLTYYKPNKSNKGYLLSISFSAKTDKFENNKLIKGDKSFYFNFVGQSGWDESKMTGSFKNGKKLNVKFNPNEVAGMIYAVRKNVTLADAMAAKGIYHDGGTHSTSIIFGPYFKKVQKNGVWVEDGPQQGFSIRVTKTEKANKENKETAGIALTFAESELLVNYLQDGLIHIFNAWRSENINRNKNYNKNKQNNDQPPPEEDQNNDGTLEPDQGGTW